VPGNPRGSGQRSGLYSDQRYTNWRTHDPYWSEVETLPKKMRPRFEVERGLDGGLGIYDRTIAQGFVRPCTAEAVANVLSAIPNEFLDDLTGVFLLGGTTRQRSLTTKTTYGMYSRGRIFLCAYPQKLMTQEWARMPKPSVTKEYTKFGTTLAPHGKGGALLTFDESSLRLFYLYDVLLHEVGHHVDREDWADNAERYAHWFAEFQHARLLES
jgi:hypothetical protein